MMTEKLREQISALADDELPAGEHELLARRFALEKYLSICWGRYHLIGEAMRKTLPQIDTRDFADHIMRALEHEAAIMKKHDDKLIRNFSKTVAGTAVAACVAVVAILGLRYDGTRMQSASTPSEIVPSAEPMQASYISNDMVRNATWNGNVPQVQAQLSNYIINHSEISTALEQQGMLPYLYLTAAQHGQESQAPRTLRTPGQPDKR